jgi:hypothetical protein
LKEYREEIQWKANTAIATSMSTNTLTDISTATMGKSWLMSTNTSTNMRMSTVMRGNTVHTIIRTSRRSWNHTTTRISREPVPAAPAW